MAGEHRGHRSHATRGGTARRQDGTLARGTRGPRASAAGKGGTGVAAADRTGRQDAGRVDRSLQRVEAEGQGVDAHVSWGHTQRNLRKLFGEGRDIATITEADAAAFAEWLEAPEPAGEGLSLPTVRKRCGNAKQFFKLAKRSRWIAANPFDDVKSANVANPDRGFFITREDAKLVSDACPDAEWRLLFALSRYGGLRCPSEHLSLRWADVDWQGGRIRVRSPKTEHHPGGAERLIPLFPELRADLKDCFDPTSEFVIQRYRSTNANLRTQLERIIKKAGLEPWPKLFHNLRASRQTELENVFPSHVVCKWIGNSQAVARKHYLQVTDEHFEMAVRKSVLPGDLNTAASGDKGRQAPTSENTKTAELTESSENPAVFDGVTFPGTIDAPAKSNAHGASKSVERILAELSSLDAETRRRGLDRLATRDHKKVKNVLFLD